MASKRRLSWWLFVSLLVIVGVASADHGSSPAPRGTRNLELLTRDSIPQLLTLDPDKLHANGLVTVLEIYALTTTTAITIGYAGPLKTCVTTAQASAQSSALSTPSPTTSTTPPPAPTTLVTSASTSKHTSDHVESSPTLSPNSPIPTATLTVTLTPSPQPNDQKNSDSGPSTGVIVGASIGGILSLIAIAIGAFLLVRYRRRRHRRRRASSDTPELLGTEIQLIGGTEKIEMMSRMDDPRQFPAKAKLARKVGSGVYEMPS